MSSQRNFTCDRLTSVGSEISDISTSSSSSSIASGKDEWATDSLRQKMAGEM